ncbi:Coq4 family protein [Thermoleptolyngbya sichuanensis XZ-Cy5]|uniref:Coq4 family protein n=1 Tax=Thermoleptolyngbya sichuanensis TaxID=2885951 RepID=UPI00240E1155|nr:Coq4 family protein [Thermoleptolyngbya sichuanensis XZ-Cy5]
MLFQKLRQLNIDLLSVGKGTISLLRNAENTDSVYDIEDGLRATKAMALAVEYVKRDEAIARLFAERYIAPPPDLEALLKLPPDSLGYVYASTLTEAGYDPNFYRKVEVTDDITYMLLRLRQTHDIWHLVTGFETSVFGELGLKAFELAQTRRPMSIVLICGGLLKTLTDAPESLEGILNDLSKGYRMGMTAKPFLAQKWEEHWERPLAEWRQELGIA